MINSLGPGNYRYTIFPPRKRLALEKISDVKFVEQLHAEQSHLTSILAAIIM